MKMSHQRKLGHSQLCNMSETLTTTDWEDVFHYDNVSECYDSFIAHFMNILDTHAPVRKITIPYNLQGDYLVPWMNPGLMTLSHIV